jgi:hypothetical protein
MLDLIRYRPITYFLLLIASVFCTSHLCGTNWNMHLLPTTPLHRRICPNSKEFEENLLLYAIANFLWTYVAIIMNVY